VDRNLTEPHAALLVQNGIELSDLEGGEKRLFIVLQGEPVRSVLVFGKLPSLEMLARVKAGIDSEKL